MYLLSDSRASSNNARLRFLALVLVAALAVLLPAGASAQTSVSCQLDGPAILCKGETATIQASVSGCSGTPTYNWSVPSGLHVDSGGGAGDAFLTVRATGNPGNRRISLAITCNGMTSAPCEWTFNVRNSPSCTIGTPTTPECGSTGNTLEATVSGGSAPYDFSWSIDAPAMSAGWAITGGQNTSILTYSAGNNGTGATFTLTVRDQNGCESECNVTVSCTSTGGCDVQVDAGGPYEQCLPVNDTSNTQCVQLNGSIGGLATSGHWTSSGTGIFRPNADVIDALYCPSQQDLAAGSITLTLTTNDPDGTCGPGSDTAQLTVHPSPTCVINPPSSAPVCGSSGNTLVVSASTGTAPYAFNWSIDAAGLAGNWAITGGQGTSIITYKAGDTGTDATFHVTVSDAHGCESECSRVVTCVAGGPCVSVDAGGPYQTCIPAGSPPGQHCVQLNGMIGLQATSGHWSTSGSGTFQPNADTIDALYCPSQADLTSGQVILTLTTNDPAGDCAPQSDTAVLTLNEGPACDIAVPSQTPVCGSSGNTLYASIAGGDAPYTITWSLDAAAISGNWAITAGLGTQAITYRAGDTGTSATFTMHILDAKGCESTCSITISCVQGGPCVTVSAGGPYQECVPIGDPLGQHCVQLNGSVGGEATSGHWTTSGTGTFQPNANTVDATYCPSAGDVNAGHVTLTLTTNDPAGACAPQSDATTLTLSGGPVCDIATPSQNPLCGSSGNTLHVNISGNSPFSITWTLDSAGQNANWAITAGQGTSTISYQAGDTGTGAVFTVQVRDENGCESQCHITISCGEGSPCVTVNAGGPYEECVPVGDPLSQHCVQLNGSIGGQATSGHWTTSGSGTFQPDANTIDATYCPSSGDVTSGSLTLTLVTNDPAGSCGPESDSATLVLTHGPFCEIGVPTLNPVCGSSGNTLHVDVSGGNSPYIITWSLDSVAQSDNWTITAGQGTSTITYRAGDSGTQATFTVHARDEDGCESECHILLSCTNTGPCLTVNAGGPYEECIPVGDPLSQHCVQLNGSIGGQATSGHWTTSGSGTFQPNASTIDAKYCPSASDLNAGRVTLTLITNDPAGSCSAGSDQAMVTLHNGGCSSPPPTGLCTVTQAFWGSEASKVCYEGERTGTMDLLDALISSATPLIVGKSGRSVTFRDGSQACIVQLLPSDGVPNALPSSLGNATVDAGTCETTPEIPLSDGRINNELLAQTITLALNLRLSPDLGDFDLTSDGSRVILSASTRDALSQLGLGTRVRDVLELANRALAGQDTGQIPLLGVNNLVNQINEAFAGRCGSCGGAAEDASLRLLGNNPNPFAVTGSTLITFALEDPGEVTIEVYNIAGRKIATLANDVFSDGVNSVRFDAAQYPDLPSGLYMYRVNAVMLGTTHVEAGKMLLIR